VCSVCGYRSLKYLGRCPNCGEWNTFIEKGKREDGRKTELQVKRLKDLEIPDLIRTKTDMEGVDNVLGGGLVKGSVILLAGSPGVGKSTLFLQIADRVSRHGEKVLIVSAEESALQVRQRAERMGITGDILVVEEENLDEVIEGLPTVSLLLIDSIQAVYTETLNSPAGSVSQVRFCADRLFRLAKRKRITVMMSGHITKTGHVAGPKTLEHIVDVVLYMEGERGSPLRILRSHKNRFGPTDEVAFFQMGERGLEAIDDPSLFFASPGDVAKVGVSYSVIGKGSLRLAVEIQSLVHHTYYPIPMRHSVGYDLRRLAIILALFEKKLNLRLGKRDVYLNVSGGLRVEEPYSDMAVAMALLSSIRNLPADNSGAFVGEISLSGEFRAPPDLPLRANEVRRLGFKRLYAPTKRKFSGLEVVPIFDLKDLSEVL